MNINKEVKDDVIVIKLDGRLDKLSSPVLDEELKPVIAENKNITFDLEKLDYISSAGLRVLLSTKKTLKEKGKDISVINIGTDVMNILTVSGFVQLLGIKQ